MYSIEYIAGVAHDDIPALPKTMRERIQKAIETRLTLDPISYGKPLQHSLRGHRRLRVGDYRVIYRIDMEHKLVTVVAISHRKSIYEGP